MTRRGLLSGAALALAGVVAAGCGMLTERRLRGRWESVDSPKRTLDLFADGSFTRRLSGKLGFLSDVLGPQKGTWRVEGEALVLSVAAESGSISEEKLPINELGDEGLVLAGERWTRKPLPAPDASPAR